MNATECKNCGTTEAVQEKCCPYIPCLYEKPFLIGSRKKNRISGTNQWKKRLVAALCLYGILIALYHLVSFTLSKYIGNAAPYDYAVYIIASIIFWPFIVIYDSDLYYCTCKKLSCLLNSSSRDLHWYSESAQSYFCIFKKGSPKSILAICINTACFLLIITVYFLKVYCPSSIQLLTDSSMLIIACSAISLLIACIEKKGRNMLVIQAVMSCGVAYYAYITEFADETIPTLFTTDFVAGTVLIILLVCIVFFIAGTTIMPMLGLFKSFFLSDFEERLQYPIDEIACSLNTIQVIKKYFLHLTGVNLLAYFQLLGCVYLLGILSTDSIVTKVLFVLGSFFPVAMYLAASVFFKKLCHKIYILQVKNIDTRIYQGISEKQLNPDEIQALVAVKEMYANEFEIHAEMSKEILAVMLTPVVTALAAVIFPTAI